MKVQESREALAPHALGRLGSHAHACDIGSPTRRSRMSNEQSAWPVPPPTTVAIPTACLMLHRETPHPISLALTTPKYPRAPTHNHPRRPEPNMDDAQSPTPNDRIKPPVTRDRHRTRPHRPIGVLPRAMTHRPQRHPEPVLQNTRTLTPRVFGNRGTGGYTRLFP